MEIRGPTSANAINITDVIGLMDGVYVSAGLNAFYVHGALASDSEFIDCYVDLNVSTGLIIEDQAIHVTIRGLFSYAYTNAIKVTRAAQVDFMSSAIYGTALGIDINDTSTSMRITGVKISDSTSGIETDGASTTTINGLSFFSCTTEITQKGSSVITISSGFMNLLNFVISDDRKSVV